MIALILDTETTDLLSNHSIKIEKLPHVIEYFGCITNLATGERLSQLSSLIKPPIAIPAKITDITSITDEMVRHAPIFSFFAHEILAQLTQAPVVIAHNMSYDKEVLDIEFERMGRKITWPRQICTVEATLHMKGYRLKLGALYELLFGETFKDAHRAKADTEALERICLKLFQDGQL
jgi:ATP-dependent DNA helicase DinG